MLSQDVLMLLRLVDEPAGSTVRSLGTALGLDPASVHRSLHRLAAAGLIDVDGRAVNHLKAEEFLLHAVKYLFPPNQSGLGRGIPTAWAAAPLVGEVAPSEEPPPVWADQNGEVRGVLVEPLHPNAPAVAQKDPRMAQFLALIDAIRLGDGRIRSLAEARLAESLRS